MSVPLNEQETTVSWYRDSDECFIYTSDPTMMTKFDKLVEKSDKWEAVSEVQEVHHEAKGNVPLSKLYKTDKNLVRMKADFNHVSDDERENMAERAKRMREKRLRNRK